VAKVSKVFRQADIAVHIVTHVYMCTHTHTNDIFLLQEENHFQLEL